MIEGYTTEIEVRHYNTVKERRRERKNGPHRVSAGKERSKYYPLLHKKGCLRLHPQAASESENQTSDTADPMEL
jgi:hypothetical protein